MARARSTSPLPVRLRSYSKTQRDVEKSNKKRPTLDCIVRRQWSLFQHESNWGESDAFIASSIVYSLSLCFGIPIYQRIEQNRWKKENLLWHFKALQSCNYFNDRHGRCERKTFQEYRIENYSLKYLCSQYVMITDRQILLKQTVNPPWNAKLCVLFIASESIEKAICD